MSAAANLEALATAQAQVALAGATLLQIEADDGRPLPVLNGNAFTAQLNDLTQVRQALAELVDEMSACNSHVGVGMASALTEDDADHATTPGGRPIAHGTDDAIEARIRRVRAAMDLAAKTEDLATYKRLQTVFSTVRQARSAEVVRRQDEEHLVAVERAVERGDRCATSPRILPGVWLGCTAESQTGEPEGA